MQAPTDLLLDTHDSRHSEAMNWDSLLELADKC